MAFHPQFSCHLSRVLPEKKNVCPSNIYFSVKFIYLYRTNTNTVARLKDLWPTCRKTLNRFNPATFFRSSTLHFPLRRSSANNSGYLETSSRPRGVLCETKRRYKYWIYQENFFKILRLLKNCRNFHLLVISFAFNENFFIFHMLCTKHFHF